MGRFQAPRQMEFEPMTTQKREVRKKFTIGPQTAAQDSTIEEASAIASDIETAPLTEAVPFEAAPVEAAPIVIASDAVEILMEEAASPAFAAPAPEEPVAEQPAVFVPETVVKATVVFAWADIWPGKTFDIWNENATAFFEFASALSKAKNMGEVVALQSQYLTGRLGSYARLSSEAASIAKEIGASPVKRLAAIG
jgi:hypothetical protein